MTGPRILRQEEFPSLLQLMDSAFPHAAPFVKTQSHNFTGLTQDLKQHIVIEENGQIISHLGLFPRLIRSGETLIKAAGVGCVATQEERRGQGLMNKLFEFAIPMMRDQGYDISVLEGDRKRYGNFGWERGGRRFAFLVSDRYVKGLKTPGISVRKYCGDRSDLATIKAFHEQEYYRLDRTPDYYDRVYDLPGRQTLLAEQGGRLAAYLTFVPETTRDADVLAWVYEYGGDGQCIKAILRDMFAAHGVTRANAVAPINHHPLNDVLLSVTDRWYTETCRMIKIISLRHLLQKSIPHMQKTRLAAGSSSEGEVTLEITGSSQIGRAHV
jgi:predicted N-acetyltransferase YhbS